MTKSDLLALLADFPDDTLLMVAGHESGLNPLAIVKPVLVERVDSPDYYGDFMLSETGPKPVGRQVVPGAQPARQSHRDRRLQGGRARRCFSGAYLEPGCRRCSGLPELGFIQRQVEFQASYSATHRTALRGTDQPGWPAAQTRLNNLLR